MTDNATLGPTSGRYESALLRPLERVLDVFDRAASLIVIVAMAVLTIVISAQVFYRYVLNSSIDWSWDVPRLCFIWMGLLAIPLGLKRNGHVGIDLVLVHLPRRWQKLVMRMHLVLMTAMMLCLAVFAARLARTTWPQLLTTIDVSVGVLYIALFLCSVHSILHMVHQFIQPPPAGVMDVEVE